jgi:hexosaminidase
MTWPRGLALSEVFWSPENKQQWAAFQQKLVPQFNRLSAAGINYSTAAFDVMAQTTHNEKKQLMADLSTDVDGLTIYYTLDNTNPDNFSLQYNGSPVEIPAGIYQLRAIAYRNKLPAGHMLIVGRDELEKRAKNPGE